MLRTLADVILNPASTRARDLTTLEEVDAAREVVCGACGVGALAHRNLSVSLRKVPRAGFAAAQDDKKIGSYSELSYPNAASIILSSELRVKGFSSRRMPLSTP